MTPCWRFSPRINEFCCLNVDTAAPEFRLQPAVLYSMNRV
jgi:hypothetical protein